MTYIEKLTALCALIVLVGLGVCAIFGGESGDRHVAALEGTAAVPVLLMDRDGSVATVPFSVVSKVVLARAEWSVREILPGSTFQGQDFGLLKLRTPDGKSTLIVPINLSVRRAEGVVVGDQLVAEASIDRVSFSKEGVAIVQVRDGARAH